VLIPESEFNNQKLLEVYRAAYLTAEMDDEGRVDVDVDGMKLLTDVDTGRGLFLVMRFNGVKDGGPRGELLEYCNAVNAKLNMIRCWLTTSSEFVVFDHATDIKGGITGEEIIDVSRRICDRVKSAWGMDESNLLK